MARPVRERIIHFTLPLSLSLFLAAVVLVIAGLATGQRVQVERSLAVQPAEDAPVVAAYLSSQSGISDALAAAGVAPEQLQKQTSYVIQHIATWTDQSVVTISIELSRPEAGKGEVTAALTEAAQKYVINLAPKKGEGAGRPQTSVDILKQQAAEDVQKLRHELSSLLEQCPGEFDSHYLPTGVSRQEAYTLSARIDLLTRRIDNTAVATNAALDFDRSVPAELTSKRLALEHEQRQLSESLGPLHPKMVRIAKELEELDQEISRLPSGAETVVPSTLDAQSLEAARKELTFLEARRVAAATRAAAAKAATGRVNTLSVQLEQAEGALASLSAASAPVQSEMAPSVDIIGERWIPVSSNAGAYLALGIVVLGIVAGLVLASNGKNRLTRVEAAGNVPPMLADLTEGN